MSGNLTDQYIDDTFDGILHVNGDPIPSSGKVVVYDGTGQASALSLGLSSVGVGATALTVGTLTYPNTNGATKSFLIHTDEHTIGRLEKITSEYLADLNPSPEETYPTITELVVNSKGQVTSVNSAVENPDYVTVTRTLYRTSRLDLGTKNLTENNWTSISVASVSDLAKSVICFIKIDADYATDSDQEVIIYASSDDGYSNSFPILSLKTNQGRSIGNGSQFVIPISPNKKFYITSDANSSSGTAWPVQIWLLGYQE